MFAVYYISVALITYWAVSTHRTTREKPFLALASAVIMPFTLPLVPLIGLVYMLIQNLKRDSVSDALRYPAPVSGSSVPDVSPCAMSSVDLDTIEVYLVSLIRSGRAVGHNRAIDFGMIKSYALSRGGFDHGNGSVSLRIMVLGKPRRFSFRDSDGFLQVEVSDLCGNSGSLGELPMIHYGRNFAIDRPRFDNYATRMGLPSTHEINDVDSSFRAEEALEQQDFSLLERVVHDAAGRHYARPEWAHYEEELQQFLSDVAREASLLDVEPSFTNCFIADPSTVDCLMFSIYGRAAGSQRLIEIGAGVIKAFWDRPEARARIMQKWG